jgi:glucosylceramidase
MKAKEIAVFSTSRDTSDRLAAKPSLQFREDSEGIENLLINIHEEVKYQKFIGIGGAFTEAAADTYYKLPEAARKEMIDAYFDPEKGLGYSFCRTHMNSCDFSLSNYADADKPGDVKLESFNIGREKKSLIPLIKEAAGKAQFKLFVSPWSPPAWMKDNGRMNGGGKLLAQYAGAWAEHFARFIEALAGEGIPVWAVTVQNEPKAVQKWDSCVFTAEEEADFVADHLYPALERHKLGHIKIMVWDHNKERVFERAAAAFKNKKAAGHIWGVAFHWYSGDHFEQLQMTHDAFPDKALVFSEGCMEMSRKSDPWGTAESYGHHIIGDINSHTAAWCDWNLILDAKGGPNHVGNFCFSPIMAAADFKSIEIYPSYYYIGHISRFITPGSVRIGCSRYTDKLECTAWLRPDGKRAVVVLNRTDEALPFLLRFQGRVADAQSTAHSIMTFVF